MKMPPPTASKPIQSFAPKTLVFMRNPPSWPAEKTPLIDGKGRRCIAWAQPVSRVLGRSSQLSLWVYTPTVSGCQSRRQYPRPARLQVFARDADRGKSGKRALPLRVVARGDIRKRQAMP